MGFEGIGAAVRRKEDLRFLSGRGHYTDDINRPHQLYALHAAGPTGRMRASSRSTPLRPVPRPASSPC